VCSGVANGVQAVNISSLPKPNNPTHESLRRELVEAGDDNTTGVFPLRRFFDGLLTGAGTFSWHHKESKAACAATCFVISCKSANTT
jgi:hypothetical protein